MTGYIQEPRLKIQFQSGHKGSPGCITIYSYGLYMFNTDQYIYPPPPPPHTHTQTMFYLSIRQ